MALIWPNFLQMLVLRNMLILGPSALSLGVPAAMQLHWDALKSTCIVKFLNRP